LRALALTVVSLLRI